MKDFEQIKQRAEAFFKQKKYQAAWPLYDEMLKDFSEAFNRYHALQMLQCHKELANYKALLEYGRRFYPRFKSFAPIRNMYALGIYYTQIQPANDKSDWRVLKKAALGMAKLCSPDDPYSPLGFALLKAASHHGMPPADRLDITACLPRDQLSSAPFEIRKPDGKNMYLPSQLERFYVLRAKALYKTGQFEQAISTARNALERIPRFHAANDLWLQRVIYRSQTALQQYDKALEMARAVCQKKPEWYLLKELAEIYHLQKVNDKALETAACAALKPGDPAKKIHLIEFLGVLYQESGQHETADLHFRAEYALRKDKDWRVPPDMQARFAKIPGSETDLHRLLADLRRRWRADCPESGIRRTGYISKLFPHGKAGFIKGDKGQSCYFRLGDFKADRRALKENLRVSYREEAAFDKKKNRPGRRARDIRVE